MTTTDKITAAIEALGGAEKARRMLDRPLSEVRLDEAEVTAVRDLALAALDAHEARDAEIHALREDRATLLAAIVDAIEEADDVVGIGDWPPDTVLGESGVCALQAMEGARNGLQVTLALPQFDDAERVIRDERARLKAWREKRHEELKAKLAAKRAEPKGGADSCRAEHLSLGHKRTVKCDLPAGHVSNHFSDLGGGATCEWPKDGA